MSLYLITLPLVAVAAGGVAGALTGRGDVVEDQQDEGGRLNSIPLAVEKLRTTGDIVDFVVGRGIGQGTNTAQGLSARQSTAPDWQILVDNTFITTFIQFGWLGSLWILFGVLAFLSSRRGDLQLPMTLVMIVASLTQNVFEQLYILLALALYFGKAAALRAGRRAAPLPLQRRQRTTLEHALP